MSEDDALHRLMQSKRPRVPVRQDISTPKSLDANTSLSQDISTPKRIEANTSLSQDISTPKRIEANTSLSQDISTPKSLDANTSLSQDIEVDLPEVVRTTTRLEKSVDKALRQLCLEEGITKEVWFEAAYLYLAEHPEALEAVNQLAQERQERRKRAADVKKLRTMHKRLSNEV